MNRKDQKELKRLAELAYERELGHWLGQLHLCFEAWRRGEMSSSKLGERIHEFHQGPARTVWSQHASLEHPEKRAAWGLAQGHLAESEIPPALLPTLRKKAEAYREVLGP